MKSPQAILIFLVLSLLCVIPSMGLTTYSGGSPQMTAAISGTNQFSPGQDAVITLVVQNRGLNAMENSWTGYSAVAAETTQPDRSRAYYPGQGNANIARDDVPTTAKMVTVGLSSGNAPILIKTDPQNIGDIAAMSSMPVTISAKITANATDGEYQLPVTLVYTYLAQSTELAADILQSDYIKKSETFPVTIRIKPQVRIAVIEAVPEHVSVGTSGYLNLTVKNTGPEDGKKATVKLIRNGRSAIIPTSGSVFVGDFPRGGTVTCRYKVSVSNDAENETYPVDVAVTYENREGDIVTSVADTVGIPVRNKLSFSIASENFTVVRGSDAVLNVRYRNDGPFTAYSAQARLSAAAPFTSTDNIAYIGDIKSGESAVAQYRVSSASDTVLDTYSLDTEVRYRDSLDHSQLSDTLRVPVQVVAQPASGGVVQVLPVLAIIVLIGAGVGYYLLVMRKKK